MAETVGPAASVVALADLFNNTVACFQFIQLDRAFGESFQRNQFELDIARLRLLRWGKSLKLDGNVPDAKSLQRHYRSGATAKHTEPLLSQTLDLAGADGASNVHNNWIEFHDNSLVVNDAQTEPDSAMSKLHETLQQLSIERQDHSGERQKAKRVLYLKTDFRRLIKSITELLNSLDKLSALSQRERRDIEIAAIGESEGVSVLREIAVDADKQLEYAFAGTSNETDVEALHRAAFDGYLFTVQLLLDKGTNIDAQSISYGSALYSASYRGREHVVKLLLNHGADVNSSAGGSYGNALYSSSFRGHEHVVKLLLDHGADVNSSVGGSYGNALQGASFHGHEHVVKLLLNHGADVNASAGGYGSALYSASLQGHEHVVKLLLSSGADVNAPGGKCGSALGAACLYGYHQVVQLLLNHGSNVEMRGGSYGTPLYIASESGKQEVVECLLAAGANPNAHDNRSIGALYRASLTGHVEIVKLMLSAGADGNASGGFYGTALQAASYQGNKVVVEILLEAGAAVNSSGGHYGQALQAACSSGDEGIVKQLLNAGADMDAEGGHFGTALQAASSGGFRNLVLILLEAGASTQSRGGKHGSALQAALCGGHQKIADILRTASTTSELQAGLPGQTNPRQRSYRNVSQMLQEVEHSDLGRSGVTLRFECEILAVVSAPELSKDRGLEGWTKELLQNNVAVVCSRSKSDGNDKIRTIRALTCIEYTESRWGSLGTRLLKDIANLCTMQPRCQLQSVYEQSDHSKFEYSLNFSGQELVVRIGHPVCRHLLKILIRALNWLCRAIRNPCQDPSSDGFNVSLSSCQVSLSNHNSSSIAGQELSSPDVTLAFTLLSEPLPELQHNCWQKLFQACFILDDEDDEHIDDEDNEHVDDEDSEHDNDEDNEHDEVSGRGLELSFDLMTSLAAVEYPTTVRGGVVLVGFHTVLIPVRFERTYVQFHLEVSKDHQINPFELDCSQNLQDLNWTRFKSMRCFVGWCDSALIKLGTSSLPPTVTYSGARTKEKSLQLSGVSTGFQFVSASPIQAGVNGQANFSFLSHRLHFRPASEYTKMLYDTAKDVVLISDVHNRRSWLVPKLSLMLHMAHVWFAENSGRSDISINPIPFAEPHDDESIVIRALEGQGDLAVCGQGNDSFKLRSLLLGLSINLLASVHHKAESTSKIIYGFEFMDIILEPGRGTPMKEVKIETSPSWLVLANLADAVIICSKLGEAIAPAQGCCRSNEQCNMVPCGQDYLAAHLSCLDRFRSRAGKEWFALDEPNPGPLYQRKIHWRVSGNPFEVCGHKVQSKDTCWKGANRLQNFDRKFVFLSKNSKEDHSGTSGSRKLGIKGAVVFGKSEG